MAYKSRLPKLLKALNRAIEVSVEDIGDAIVARAVNLVPVKTGNLQRSIFNEPLPPGDEDLIGRIISSRTPYSAAIEYGTDPHEIVPKDRKALHWKGPGGKDMFATRVWHPGTQAQPYMRPAVDAITSGNRVRNIVEKNTYKMAKRYGIEVDTS